MREVVELDPEVALGFRTEDLVQLAYASGRRLDVVELVADDRSQLRRMLLERDDCLQHLEEAGLSCTRTPPCVSQRAELGDLLAAPLGFDVAGRENGHESSNISHLVDESLAEQVVAGQLGIAPDLRAPAEQLRDLGLEGAMEVGDPTLVAFAQTEIVEVGIADKRVSLERHSRHCITQLMGTRTASTDEFGLNVDARTSDGPGLDRRYARGRSQTKMTPRRRGRNVCARVEPQSRRDTEKLASIDERGPIAASGLIGEELRRRRDAWLDARRCSPTHERHRGAGAPRTEGPRVEPQSRRDTDTLASIEESRAGCSIWSHR